MPTLPDLHDGFFDGVCLPADKQARLFVRTSEGERFTIALIGVEALSIHGFRAGNIIFEVTHIMPENLTVKDVAQAHDLRPEQAEMAQQLFGKAQKNHLSALEINSSYGAEAQVLFRRSRPSQGTFWRRLRPA
ncbi:MAG TPA: hypothetical protein VMB18_06875 [Terriglobales bacterium]|nr:hypothetical protein [Terriglobales bacterium]